MIQNKNLIYGLVLIAGIILVWMVYSEQGVRESFDLAAESQEDLRIIVDGKVAPKLTNFVAHMEFI